MVTEIYASNKRLNYREAIVELLTLFERSREQNGWGGEQETNAILGVVSAEPVSGHVGLSITEVPLPDEFEGYPVETLSMLALHLFPAEKALQEDEPDKDSPPNVSARDYLDHITPRGFVGFVVSVEGFQITSEDVDVEQYHGRASEHPDRVENRIVVFSGLAEIAGHDLSVALVRLRGQSDDEVTVNVIERGSDKEVEGRLYAAMYILVTAACGSMARRYPTDGFPFAGSAESS